MLRAMATELEDDASNLVDGAMDETALPRPRLEGELRRTAFQLRFFAEVVEDGAFLDVSIDHAGDSPMGPLPDLRRMRVAMGPVGVFGSSNFPFAFSVPGGDTASALAAGCPVVIKAHPAHPATSQRTFDALVRGATSVQAPPGTLALIFGLDAGINLVDDPAIAAVGFTGSVAAGRALWQRANERSTPIPFYGELGSANPLVVTTSAATERASEIGVGLAGSMTLGVGQFCTKPGILFVPATNDGDNVVAALSGALRELPSMTMLTSGIADHFRSGTSRIGDVLGTQLLVGGPDASGASVEAKLFEVSAATFVQSSSSVLYDECFGPVAVIVRYQSNQELTAALSSIEPALTFSVFAGENDTDTPWLLSLGETKAGRVIFNQFPTGVGVSWSMQHGGPWPSTTAPWATSVGAAGIERWLRPVTYQAVPENLLPLALRDNNPLAIPQRVNGVRR
jgi:NADP-dependent aldehyde dehydrogenase